MSLRWKKILPYDTLSGLQYFQLFRFGSAFLISIILPRSGLQPAAVGLYESFIFFAGIVSYFWLTGLIQALLPLAAARPTTDGGKGTADGGRQTAEGGRHFFNAFVLLLAFTALAGLALWLFSPVLGKLLQQELPRELIGLVILYLISFAPSTLVEYWYVITDQSKKLLRYGTIAFTLQLLLVGIPVVMGLGVKSAMWGMIVAGTFRTVWLIAILARNREFRIDLPFWKEYLALGGPVVVSVLLSGSAQYVNGFIVSAWSDAATFALFRYGARELPLIATLAYALSNAMTAVIAREGREAGLVMLRKRSARMASWMFPLSIGVLISSYLIFPLIYGWDYLESAGVVNLFILLIVSRLLFPHTVLLASGRTRILMSAALIELILNIGLSLLLIRLWGIRGVALATVIAYYVERIILVAYTRKALGIPLRAYTDIRKMGAWTALLLMAYLLAEVVIYPLVRG
ncbi:MAG: polysaccharide biosynthesis C-terminal domain-containing protein [Bacteroidales bacterium]